MGVYSMALKGREGVWGLGRHHAEMRARKVATWKDCMRGRFKGYP